MSRDDAATTRQPGGRAKCAKLSQRRRTQNNLFFPPRFKYARSMMRMNITRPQYRPHMLRYNVACQTESAEIKWIYIKHPSEKQPKENIWKSGRGAPFKIKRRRWLEPSACRIPIKFLPASRANSLRCPGGARARQARVTTPWRTVMRDTLAKAETGPIQTNIGVRSDVDVNSSDIGQTAPIHIPFCSVMDTNLRQLAWVSW